MLNIKNSQSILLITVNHNLSKKSEISYRKWLKSYFCLVFGRFFNKLWQPALKQPYNFGT